ncbi:unnamed protein product, partial [Larinioides sclopetarius]
MKLSKKSLLICLKEPPVLTILQQVSRPKRCSVTSEDTVNTFDSKSFLLYRNGNVCRPTVFMQDGATLHIGRQIKKLFRANFGE